MNEKKLKKGRQFMKKLVLFMALLTAIVSISFAEDALLYKPSETYVAVVPVVSTTGDKWKELKISQMNCTYNELESQFAEREFLIIEPSEIVKAINEFKIDFTDEEQIKKDNLYKIGEKIGATLIVFVLITDSTQRVKTTYWISQNEGYAKIKIWLLDVPQKNAIKSAKVYDAKRVQGDKGSTMQIEAARRAVQEALKDFLKPYKVTTKVKREERPQPSLTMSTTPSGE
jgi:hypothetical protein